MTNNVDLILDAFTEQQRTWKINGEYSEPKREHITIMLERGRQALEKEDINSSFESGGIIMTKDANGHFDVYVHVGELDLDEVEPT